MFRIESLKGKETVSGLLTVLSEFEVDWVQSRVFHANHDLDDIVEGKKNR